MAKSSNFAYEAIRDSILSGRYASRTHLRETAIAAEIGVSRTPIREALRRLAADGYVTMVPNQGAFVNPWSDDSLSELINVRAELASLAAAGAARNIPPEQIMEMTDIVMRMSQIESSPDHKEIDEQTTLNLRFHKIIFDHCGNRWLATLLQQTSNVANVHRAYYSYSREDWSRAVERYEDLIMALGAGDAGWAGAIFKAHFLASKHAITSRSANRKSIEPATARKKRTRGKRVSGSRQES